MLTRAVQKTQNADGRLGTSRKYISIGGDAAVWFSESIRQTELRLLYVVGSEGGKLTDEREWDRYEPELAVGNVFMAWSIRKLASPKLERLHEASISLALHYSTHAGLRSHGHRGVPGLTSYSPPEPPSLDLSHRSRQVQGHGGNQNAVWCQYGREHRDREQLLVASAGGRNNETTRRETWFQRGLPQ